MLRINERRSGVYTLAWRSDISSDVENFRYGNGRGEEGDEITGKSGRRDEERNRRNANTPARRVRARVAASVAAGVAQGEDA